MVNGTLPTAHCLCDAGYTGPTCAYTLATASCAASSGVSRYMYYGLYDESPYISTLDDTTCLQGSAAYTTPIVHDIWPRKACYPPEINPVRLQIAGQALFRNNASTLPDATQFLASAVMLSRAAFQWAFRPADVYDSSLFTIHDATQTHRTLLKNGSLSLYHTEAVQWRVNGSFVTGFTLYTNGTFLRLATTGIVIPTLTATLASFFQIIDDSTHDVCRLGGGVLLANISRVAHGTACRHHCMRDASCVYATHAASSRFCSLYSTAPVGPATGAADCSAWNVALSHGCPIGPLAPTCGALPILGPLRILQGRGLGLARYGSTLWMTSRTTGGQRDWIFESLGGREYNIRLAGTTLAIVGSGATVTAQTYVPHRLQSWMLQTTCGSQRCSLNEQGSFSFCLTADASRCLHYDATVDTQLHVGALASLFSVGWLDEDQALPTATVFVGSTPTFRRNVAGLTLNNDISQQSQCRSLCANEVLCSGYTLSRTNGDCSLLLSGAMQVTGLVASTNSTTWVRSDYMPVAAKRLWQRTAVLGVDGNANAPVCTNGGVLVPVGYTQYILDENGASLFNQGRGVKTTYYRNPISVYHNDFEHLFGTSAISNLVEDSNCLPPELGPFMIVLANGGQLWALNGSYAGGTSSAVRVDSPATVDVDYWIFRPTNITNVYHIMSAHNRLLSLAPTADYTGVMLVNRLNTPYRWTLRRRGQVQGNAFGPFANRDYFIETADVTGFFLQKTSSTTIGLVALSSVLITPPTGVTVSDDASLHDVRLFNEDFGDINWITGASSTYGPTSTYQRLFFSTQLVEPQLACSTACMRHLQCNAVRLYSNNQCDLVLDPDPQLLPTGNFGGLTWIRPSSKRCLLPGHGPACDPPSVGPVILHSNGAEFLQIGGIYAFWIVSLQQSEAVIVPLLNFGDNGGLTFRYRSSTVLAAIDGVVAVTYATNWTDGRYTYLVTTLELTTDLAFAWTHDPTRFLTYDGASYLLDTPNHFAHNFFSRSYMLPEFDDATAPTLEDYHFDQHAPEHVDNNDPVDFGGSVRFAGSVRGMSVCETLCRDDPVCIGMEYHPVDRNGRCYTYALIEFVPRDEELEAYTWLRSRNLPAGLNASTLQDGYENLVPLKAAGKTFDFGDTPGLQDEAIIGFRAIGTGCCTPQTPARHNLFWLTRQRIGDCYFLAEYWSEFDTVAVEVSQTIEFVENEDFFYTCQIPGGRDDFTVSIVPITPAAGGDSAYVRLFVGDVVTSTEPDAVGVSLPWKVLCGRHPSGVGPAPTTGFGYLLAPEDVHPNECWYTLGI